MLREPLAPLDLGTVWQKLQRLLARLVESADRPTFLDESLDTLVELLGADRGLVLLLHDNGSTQAINARARGRALDPFEREEISKTVVRRVQETQATVRWRPVDELDPSESIHLLGIGTAIAAPLRAVAWGEASPGRLRGVLYLDFRDRRRDIGDLPTELVEAAANVMAAVLAPHERLELAREDLRALSARPESSGPTLEELLRPESMRPLRAEVASCLRGDAPILILGDSGTGKTQLARAIAEAGQRTPVVRAVLGSSDDLNTITSELFGHEKGAFSGALARRTGVVEFADGGTLILDEILNLPPHAQQLLLDFTQFGTYRPLGYERREPKHARVRLIAATNGDLDAAMASGRFRQDLYYRIASVTLALPSLRERREDIPSLAEGVLRRLDPGHEWRLSVPLRRLLMSAELAWPGNVRQLEAVISRARDRALLRDPAARTLSPDDLAARDLGCASLSVPAPKAVPQVGAPLSAGFQVEIEELGDSWARLGREREALDGFEKKIITTALERHAGVAAHAARELGVGRTSLLSRMDTLGISRSKRPGRGSAGGRDEP